MTLKKRYYSIRGQIFGEEAIGGTRTDYAVDALGSVTGTLEVGSLRAIYFYKPFGSELQKIGVGTDPSFRWVGKRGYRWAGDPHSNVYIRARTYAPRLGRWTTCDPNWPGEQAFTYVSN